MRVLGEVVMPGKDSTPLYLVVVACHGTATDAMRHSLGGIQMEHDPFVVEGWPPVLPVCKTISWSESPLRSIFGKPSATERWVLERFFGSTDFTRGTDNDMGLEFDAKQRQTDWFCGARKERGLSSVIRDISISVPSKPNVQVITLFSGRLPVRSPLFVYDITVENLSVDHMQTQQIETGSTTLQAVRPAWGQRPVGIKQLMIHQILRCRDVSQLALKRMLLRTPDFSYSGRLQMKELGICNDRILKEWTKGPLETSIPSHVLATVFDGYSLSDEIIGVCSVLDGEGTRNAIGSIGSARMLWGMLCNDAMGLLAFAPKVFGKTESQRKATMSRINMIDGDNERRIVDFVESLVATRAEANQRRNVYGEPITLLQAQAHAVLADANKMAPDHPWRNLVHHLVRRAQLTLQDECTAVALTSEVVDVSAVEGMLNRINVSVHVIELNNMCEFATHAKSVLTGGGARYGQDTGLVVVRGAVPQTQVKPLLIVPNEGFLTPDVAKLRPHFDVMCATMLGKFRPFTGTDAQRKIGILHGEEITTSQLSDLMRVCKWAGDTMVVWASPCPGVRPWVSGDTWEQFWKPRVQRAGTVWEDTEPKMLQRLKHEGMAQDIEVVEGVEAVRDWMKRYGSSVYDGAVYLHQDGPHQQVVPPFPRTSNEPCEEQRVLLMNGPTGTGCARAPIMFARMVRVINDELVCVWIRAEDALRVKLSTCRAVELHEAIDGTAARGWFPRAFSVPRTYVMPAVCMDANKLPTWASFNTIGVLCSVNAMVRGAASVRSLYGLWRASAASTGRIVLLCMSVSPADLIKVARRTGFRFRRKTIVVDPTVVAQMEVMNV
jgi:hypothetical protein